MWILARSSTAILGALDEGWSRSKEKRDTGLRCEKARGGHIINLDCLIRSSRSEQRVVTQLG